MKKKLRIFSSILLIMLLSLGIRLYKLDELPGILNRDEAALAYNAVLLKTTGLDEWQRPWPLALESFGDYKLPGYVVSLVLLFQVLPLADWVVRLPAVIASVLLIPLSYLLLRKFGTTKISAITTAFLLATTPIFFFYARMAFEALLALVFWITAHYLLLSTQSKPNPRWHDPVAVLLLVLAILSYNTPFLLLPTLLIVLPVNRGLTAWRTWLPTFFALLLTFTVAAWVFLPLTSQKKAVTIFSDETTNTQSIEYRQTLPNVLQPVLGHKYVFFLGKALSHTIASFSPAFLVMQGGSHPWHTLPGFSHLSWTVYVLGLIGIGVTTKTLIKSPKNARIFKLPAFVLLWLALTSLLPSIITIDAPHATRSLPFMFWWLCLAGIGLDFLLACVQSKQKKYGMLALVVISQSVLFALYLQSYFVIFPKNQPQAFTMGFAQAIQEAEAKYPDTPVAVIDSEGFHYIITAWYLQLSPSEYFATNVRQLPNTIGFRYGEKVANYHFIAYPNDREKTGEKVMLNWSENQWQLQTF